MWVVGSDMHVPDHDKRAWQGFLDFVADWKPHGVCINGDFAECQSFSAHGDLTNPGYWLEERDACRRELARLRKAAGPRARMVYNEGNHETRITRSMAHNAPNLAGVLTVRDQLRLDALGIEWRPEGNALRLGKLRVVHGRWASKYAAAKHVDALGSCLVGHVHRPGMQARPMDGHTQVGWVAPCLRDLEAGYLHGYPSGWAHGFAIVHVYPDGYFNCELIVMDPDRRFAYGGRLYGG
jgi:UDP-2,3-diacylglucosamine pyrophosphatase LpxH